MADLGKSSKRSEPRLWREGKRRGETIHTTRAGRVMLTVAIRFFFDLTSSSVMTFWENNLSHSFGSWSWLKNNGRAMELKLSWLLFELEDSLTLLTDSCRSFHPRSKKKTLATRSKLAIEPSCLKPKSDRTTSPSGRNLSWTF